MRLSAELYNELRMAEMRDTNKEPVKEIGLHVRRTAAVDGARRVNLTVAAHLAEVDMDTPEDVWQAIVADEAMELFAELEQRLQDSPSYQAAAAAAAARLDERTGQAGRAVLACKHYAYLGTFYLMAAACMFELVNR